MQQTHSDTIELQFKGYNRPRKAKWKKRLKKTLIVLGSFLIFIGIFALASHLIISNRLTLADSLAEKGEFEEALAIYNTLPGFSAGRKLRNADILKKAFAQIEKNNLEDGIKYILQFGIPVNINYTLGNDEVLQGEKSESYTSIDEFTGLPSPQKENETFIGWEIDSFQYQVNDAIIAFSLLPKWKRNSYTISLIADNVFLPTNTLTVSLGDSYSLPIPPERSGYNFLGWFYEDEQVTDGVWNRTTDITLFARWQKLVCSITLNANGGSLASNTLTAKSGESYTLPIPSRVGYNFLGWFCGDEVVTDGIWNKNDDLTLDAKWEGQQYSINLNVNGGIISTDTSLSVTFGEKFILPIPEKDNHTFLGWYNGNTQYTSSVWSTIGNINLVAKWSILYEWESSPSGAIITKYCGSDTNLVLPETINGISVVALGDNAFSGSNIETITLSKHIQSIGNNTFEKCSMLTKIDIPAGITTIGSSVFANCTSLTSIQLPNSITSIGSYAFASTPIITITIPEGVSTIGDAAFFNCQSLTNITLSSTVKILGSSVFKSCAKLTSITLPQGLTHIGSHAFDGCTALQSVNIPYGITAIEAGVFSQCKSLSTIIIPETVTSIGANAFASTPIITITIPEGVSTIGDAAFFNCQSLTNITLSSTVKILGSSVFKSCAKLTSISLPQGLTHIGSHAFDGCTALQSVNIPYGITAIEPSVFSECESLSDIIIPETVLRIGEGAFACCYSIKSISIPNSVVSIGDCAFYDCERITQMNIPSSVTDIGVEAFSYCIRLSSIVINDGVTFIGDLAFSGCNSLETIVFPDSITYVGRDVFQGCTNLNTIYCEATSQPADWESSWNASDLPVVWNYKPE